MASLITVVSGNGGMGKSVFACNLACGLKHMDNKVLLAELSFGTVSDDAILGIKCETLFNIKDICEGTCDISEAVTRPDDKNLPDFIPASPFGVRADFGVAFDKIKKKFAAYYDYIIFDVPHIRSAQTEDAVKVSDIVIALTDDSFISLRNTSLCVNYVRTLGVTEIYTVLSRVTVDNTASSAYVEDVIDETGAALLGIVPHDEYMAETVANGTPIVRYNTFAGRAYENICKRLLGQSVPEFETGVQNGFFARNKLTLKKFL